MILFGKVEVGEPTNAFTVANAFYEFCKRSSVDVATVAQMMLLEATNEANQRLCDSQCYARSDTE